MHNENANPLPTTWEAPTIGDIYKVVGGGTPSTTNEDYWNGNVPWVTSADINGIRSVKVKRYVTEKGIKKSTTNMVPAGTLLVVTRVGLGKIAISTQPMCFSQDMQGLIQNPSLVLPEYSLHFLSFELQRLKFEGRGTTISGLTKKQLKDTVLPLAPYAEQRRIVTKIEELFSELDKGIENLQVAREQLKTYRQAVLKYAFEGRLTAGWRTGNKHKLETGDELLARVKKEREDQYQKQIKEWEFALQQWQANCQKGRKPSRPKRPASFTTISPSEEECLAKLPMGWTYIRLGSLIDEPKYGTSKKCHYDVDGIGVLRIPNVAQGIVDATDLKFARFDVDEIQTYNLKSGDLLTIRSNGSISLVGKCALVSELEEHYLYAGYLIRLRPNQRLILPQYLLYLLSGHPLRTQIEQKAKSTSGVNNINSGEIQSLIVPVCSIAEQQELMNLLVSTLSSIDAAEAAIDEQIVRSESLRHSILKKAFSGQLVEQDANDEPASALLDRIKAEKTTLTKPNKKTRNGKEAA